MSYTSDIPQAPRDSERPATPAEIYVRETAAAYARLFSSDEGRRVLKDLQAKFGHSRPRFQRAAPTFEPIRAALIDGECAVIREIENAILAGGGQP